MKKFYILVGPPNTGKSTALRVLENLFYRGATTTSMQSMADSHGTEGLSDARVALSYDMSEKNINSVSMIKQLVYGEPYENNPKFRTRHTVSNYKIKFAFAMNALPNMPNDLGIYERAHIIAFNTQFPKRPGSLELWEELNTPHERAALFNILLPIIHRLRKTRDGGSLDGHSAIC